MLGYAMLPATTMNLDYENAVEYFKENRVPVEHPVRFMLTVQAAKELAETLSARCAVRSHRYGQSCPLGSSPVTGLIAKGHGRSTPVPDYGELNFKRPAFSQGRLRHGLFASGSSTALRAREVQEYNYSAAATAKTAFNREGLSSFGVLSRCGYTERLGLPLLLVSTATIWAGYTCLAIAAYAEGHSSGRHLFGRRISTIVASRRHCDNHSCSRCYHSWRWRGVAPAGRGGSVTCRVPKAETGFDLRRYLLAAEGAECKGSNTGGNSWRSAKGRCP